MSFIIYSTILKLHIIKYSILNIFIKHWLISSIINKAMINWKMLFNFKCVKKIENVYNLKTETKLVEYKVGMNKIT